MATKTHKHISGRGFGPATIITAFVLYGLTAFAAIYVGTIAIMPQGAILCVALFVLATWALRVFLRHPGRSVESYDDDDYDDNASL